MIAPEEKPPSSPGEEDDFDLDLSESTSVLGEDDSNGPEDDSDSGVDEEDREIGLDVETGLEDGLDAAEEVSADDDAGSWLDDEVGTAAGDEDDEGSDEEEGALGEDGEPDSASDFDDDLAFEEKESIAEDSGDEGFGDDSILAGIDLGRLPKLDTPGDGEEGVEIEIDLPVEPETEPAIAALEPPRAPRTLLESLVRSGRPLSALVAAGETGIAWDGSLLVAEPDSTRAERRFADAATVQVLASTSDSARLIALGTPEGVLCSHDGGRSFAAAVGMGSSSGASALAVTDVGAGPVLWASPPAGALQRSEDGGRSFEPVAVLPRVLRLASDGRGQLVVLGRDAKSAACAARSDDGGETFAALRLPFSEVERAQDLQVCGPIVLCSRRGLHPQLVWCGDDGEFRPLFRDAAPPCALIDERGTARVYCVRSVRGVHSLVRVELGAIAGTPELVLELPADAGAPLQLAGTHRDGVTTLQLGCERVWFRVRVWAEGLLV